MKTVELKNKRRQRRIIPSQITTKLLKEKASAIFTSKAHPKMSERYKIVKTQDVINELSNLGFIPFDADQVKYRNSENTNQGYQYHSISLFHPNMVILNSETESVEEIFEIVVTNSYNGYSKCSVYCSFYRVISNTDMLCISDNFMETISDIEQIKNQDFFNKITNHFLDMVKCINKMKSTFLNKNQKIKVAEKMMKIRHNIQNEEEIPYKSIFLLEPLRKEDNKNDLWTIYNVIQEKLIKGYQFPKNDGEKIGRKIRSINHFEISLNINKQMFNEIKICD